MLLTILDKITSYMILFALIATIKANTLVENMGIQSMIWVSIFILDFVSTWFTVYSKYLAGDRTQKVSNLIENIILAIYRSNVIGFVAVDILAELFIATQIVSHSKVLSQF